LPLPGTVTDATGSDAPFSNMQPSIALNHTIALEPGTDSFVGRVGITARNFAINGNAVPAGMVVANGQLLAIADNTPLANRQLPSMPVTRDNFRTLGRRRR
jgi:microcystin-dependent protein